MCTFTYDRPVFIAVIWALVSVPVPDAPVLQGPQSGTSTAPGTPFLPAWMWAALAAPVKWLNVSVQLIDKPVTVAVKWPDAPAFVPARMRRLLAGVQHGREVHLRGVRAAGGDRGQRQRGDDERHQRYELLPH